MSETAITRRHAIEGGTLAAWMTSVLEPPVAELRLSRERIEALADERAQFRTERDAARAELDAEKRSKSPLMPSTAPHHPPPVFS